MGFDIFFRTRWCFRGQKFEEIKSEQVNFLSKNWSADDANSALAIAGIGRRLLGLEPLDSRLWHVPDQRLASVRLARVLLALQSLHERGGIKEDLDLADLEGVGVDGDPAHAEHADDLASADVGAVAAAKLAPVSPGEDDVRRSAEDLQELPREAVAESPAEDAVRGLEVVVEAAWNLWKRKS